MVNTLYWTLWPGQTSCPGCWDATSASRWRTGRGRGASSCAAHTASFRSWHSSKSRPASWRTPPVTSPRLCGRHGHLQHPRQGELWLVGVIILTPDWLQIVVPETISAWKRGFRNSDGGTKNGPSRANLELWLIFVSLKKMCGKFHTRVWPPPPLPSLRAKVWTIFEIFIFQKKLKKIWSKMT